MKLVIKGISLIGLVLAVCFFLINMKEDDPNAITVAFYNVENLFDTISDPHTNDNKYLPDSKNAWTSKRYWHKIENLGEVVSGLGDSNGPEILGLCEIENKAVLTDFIQSNKIKDRCYGVIHFDSHDRRGIDVALLYKKNVFKPYAYQIKTIEVDPNFRTRDLLIVSGVIKSDTIHFIVNHWPSRLGGEEESEDNRIIVAKVARAMTDSIVAKHKNAKVLLMGDFNDLPSNKSIVEVLKAKKDIKECKTNDLYNPFYHLMKEGRGTYKYKGEWEMLDQMIISKSLVEGKKLKYKQASEDIYSPLWMYYKEKSIHGPYRTFVGSKYYGGYSDHFPVYLQLVFK